MTPRTHGVPHQNSTPAQQDAPHTMPPPRSSPEQSWGLLLRLAAPVAAYGAGAVFNHRDTARHPTRSAVIGLLAAAAGRDREHALDPFTDLPGTPGYHDVRLTIRADKPGTVHTDYHVTGGGYPRAMTLQTSAGKRRPPNRSALPTHRDYLHDAAFTIAVTGPAPLIETVARHLERPRHAPYLGRRACLPDEPLLLRGPHTDPHHQLLHHAPLTLHRPPAPAAATVPVTFWWEQQLRPTRAGATEAEQLNDHPLDFTPHARSHASHTWWTTTEQLPLHLYPGPWPHPALADYLREQEPCTCSPPA
ncbi:type I-E CRISPR-associated protein Cas5/CasD [Streptomyces griseoluteus]|uniref:type I-E CRISPR-associated protein Cas5/CasD n=1 Tax=Streptomyces griseoluteus TaxID=29306 RepID=UPI0034072444